MQWKALSIKQPWAWLICNGSKDVENRTWHTRFRGYFLVHAGQKFDRAALPFLRSRRIELPNDFDMGGIVGIAAVVGCVRAFESLSDWAMAGGWCIELRERRSLPFVPCLGRLSFFPVAPEVVSECERRGIRLPNQELRAPLQPIQWHRKSVALSL